MKTLLPYKVRSSALQFAIFISILIALLLGSLVLYVYTFINFKEQSKSAIENIHHSDSAINYLLRQQKIVADTIPIKVLEKENQHVTIASSQWGIFEKVYVRAQHRQKIFKKTALLGSEIKSLTAPTLFLQETFTPLSLVGNTVIKGNVCLPAQGVKPGYIAGQSYSGTRFINGTSQHSETELPKINGDILKGLYSYAKSHRPENDIDLKTHGNASNSFEEKTQSYTSHGKIILEGCSISGNIVIQSDTLIVVKKTALLKDIILISPTVIIEDNTTGNFQAIASRKIWLGLNCSLSYPSALVLIQDNKDAQANIGRDPSENKITIGAQTIFRGVACYLQTRKSDDFNTNLVLEKQSKIKGEVYCEGNFELKGTVSGRVFTKKFVSNVAESVFINHIYNGIIENVNIPETYSGILMVDDKKSIAKWLY